MLFGKHRKTKTPNDEFVMAMAKSRGNIPSKAPAKQPEKMKKKS